MRKGFVVFVLFLMMLLAPSVGAETFAVSPGGLTAALAQAKDGDILELADGYYGEPEETFPLTVARGVTIRPQEGAHPVVDAPAMKMAFRVEADGVTIQGLEIRFRRTGLYLIGDNVTVEDCSILLADPAWRTSSCGAWMGGIRGAAFRNCAFTGCGIAVAGPPLSETSHLVPVLTGLFEVGESRDFFTTHTITDCTVNGKPLFYAAGQQSVVAPENAGEILIADCAEVLVRNADVSQASMGMEIIYCDNVRVENSRADECGVFGIYLAKLEQAVVDGCATRGTNHGIDIRACRNVTVQNSRADECDQGIFYSKVDGGLVKDCVVTSTGQGYFFAAGNHCQIYRCQAIDCENGMNIQKENDMLILGCTFRGCTICAARLDGSPTIFANNLLEDNWVAVMAYGDVPFNLMDNTIQGSGSCGLYLRDIAYSRISGNTITGSAGNCIEAQGEMNETLLTGNTLDKEIATSKGAVLRFAEAS